MKNAPADLDTVSNHSGSTLDDVIAEGVFAATIARFLEVASYRDTIYTMHFPTGTWLGD